MPIGAFSYGFFAFFCFSKNSSFSPAPGVTKCLRPIFLRKRNFCDRLDYFLQAQFCCTDVTQINPRIPSIKFGHLQHWSQLSPNQNELSSGLGGRTALRLLIHSSMDSTALDLSHHSLSHSIDQIYLSFLLRFYCYQTETSMQTDARNIAGAGEDVNISHRDPGNSACPQQRRLSLWGLA